ncbi:hypothetical protein HY772_07655 [Candidatus Woesearchaeota archaeon]|nr:hypothetical protein [Candidatus Woesearchaeota archaeon]
MSGCCERPQPVPVPVPAPVDLCTERCGEVKLRCYGTCKEKAKGDDKSLRSCEAQCAPEVERCYKKCRPEKEQPKEEPRPLPPVKEPPFPCAERCANAAADCKDECRHQYADLQKEANDEFPRKMGLCYQERCESKMKECLRGCEGQEGETGTATRILRDRALPPEAGEPTVAEAPAGEEPQGDESEQDAAMKRRRSFFEWLFGK